MGRGRGMGRSNRPCWKPGGWKPVSPSYSHLSGTILGRPWSQAEPTGNSNGRRRIPLIPREHPRQTGLENLSPECSGSCRRGSVHISPCSLLIKSRYIFIYLFFCFWRVQKHHSSKSRSGRTHLWWLLGLGKMKELCPPPRTPIVRGTACCEVGSRHVNEQFSHRAPEGRCSAHDSSLSESLGLHRN